MSLKYSRTRKKKNKIIAPREPTQDLVAKPVIKISERPLIKLHKLREDFQQITQDLDTCFERAIENLTHSKPIDLNAIISFMEKQITLLDQLSNRIPEKQASLKTAIKNIQIRALTTITDLETLAAEGTKTYAVSTTFPSSP